MRNAPKVLIVDDDKASAASLSEIVKRMGLKPIVVYKAADALNIVRLQVVQAAIVDVLLPKTKGIDLVLEFRKTRFADSPVVFVSGVFKDRGFAHDAVTDTKAVGFLFKPFQNDELTQILSTSLAHLLSAEKHTVQSLLNRKLSSDRERAKAIEHLEEMKGMDFPFVLSILMEVGSSGNLNIVNDSGEIFGVSLVNGTIAEVDSSESQSSAVLSLISKGFLSQEDWDVFLSAGGKKFTLEKLVAEGVVSPHAVSEARREQIITDFRTICAAQSLQVNFVPQEDGEDPPKHAVKLQNLMDLFLANVNEFFPEEYLNEFYSPLLNAPLRLFHMSAQVARLWETDLFKDMGHLKAIIEASGDLEQALARRPDMAAKTYQCVHCLVLIRALMFDDVNRAKKLNSMLERYQKLFDQLDGKPAHKIFEYFGAQITANSSVFQNIFDEYYKSNNPDHLGKEATPELRELSRKCFEIVRTAKDIMIDDAKREQLLEKIKTESQANKDRSARLTLEALESIRTGRPKDALVQLKEAEKLFVSNRWHIVMIWAELKVGLPENKNRLVEMGRKLDGMLSEERKNPLYYMALGLLKKAQGDPTAVSHFEKALQLDSEFTDAIRELNSKTPAKKEKLDIFNSDISQVVSHIFRRKAE